MKRFKTVAELLIVCQQTVFRDQMGQPVQGKDNEFILVYLALHDSAQLAIIQCDPSKKKCKLMIGVGMLWMSTPFVRLPWSVQIAMTMADLSENHESKIWCHCRDWLSPCRVLKYWFENEKQEVQKY